MLRRGYGGLHKAPTKEERRKQTAKRRMQSADMLTIPELNRNKYDKELSQMQPLTRYTNNMILHKRVRASFCHTHSLTVIIASAQNMSKQ